MKMPAEKVIKSLTILCEVLSRVIESKTGLPVRVEFNIHTSVTQRVDLDALVEAAISNSWHRTEWSQDPQGGALSTHGRNWCVTIFDGSLPHINETQKPEVDGD